jgi:hypothetical protein
LFTVIIISVKIVIIRRDLGDEPRRLDSNDVSTRRKSSNVFDCIYQCLSVLSVSVRQVFVYPLSLVKHYYQQSDAWSDSRYVYMSTFCACVYSWPGLSSQRTGQAAELNGCYWQQTPVHAVLTLDCQI